MNILCFTYIIIPVAGGDEIISFKIYDSTYTILLPKSS